MNLFAYAINLCIIHNIHVNSNSSFFGVSVMVVFFFLLLLGGAAQAAQTGQSQPDADDEFFLIA
jgi:hypothetical protein